MQRSQIHSQFLAVVQKGLKIYRVMQLDVVQDTLLKDLSLIPEQSGTKNAKFSPRSRSAVLGDALSLRVDCCLERPNQR